MDSPENNQNALKAAIGKLGVHDHLCLIYESREEQLAAVIPFMRIGLERGERCVYIADDNTVATVVEAMRAEGIDVDGAINSGALSVTTKHEAYLKEDRFDPDWMIDFLKEAITAAKADGYGALRVTGEMTWMLGGDPGSERLIEYEAKLNYFIPEHDCLAICQYNRNRFDPEIIINVIRTHPLVIYGTTICKNFYYVPPDEFLEAEKQRGFVETERLLASLVDREQAEQELSEAHRLLETIFDHTHMMVALLDPQLNFIRVNRAYANADKKEPSFFPGKNHFELYPNKENEEIFRRVVETGEPHFAIAKPFQYEENPERGVSYWDWSLVLIKDEDGVVASLIFMLLNVTERVESEEAIIRSEEKYRSLFEESKDGIIITTPGGKIENINPAGVEMLGYSSGEELQALDSAYELYMNPEDRDVYMQTLKQQEFVKNYELDLKRKDGEPLVVSITTSVMRDENGKIISFRGIMRDLTAHRQLEQQLMQAQKMESIGRLAGGIAHDFNNFLTAIQGYIDLAAMDLPEGSPAGEDLMEARASSDRAASLSRQLLLFSRRENLDLKPVDLNRVISDLPKMLGHLIGEQHEIKTEPAEDLMTVNADASHLEQVLMNLAVNARDAMPNGGVITIKTVNVAIEPGHVKAKSRKPPHEFVELSVSDNGVGMDADVLSHIFEPFFSTKGAGKGTGLGLSVVYGIITQHGGWIDVDSMPGMGTTFKIYLPAQHVVPAGEQAQKIPMAEVTGHGEGVLLVEDDDDIRKMVNKSLADHGYQVFKAADAESALELFEREEGRIDLVFSDVVLPGQDGVWLVDQLKKRKPGLEVLLASGYSEAMEQQTISDRGYRLMRKPYSLSEVLIVINGMLSK
ncbi:MAG: MEDS domain-containing protein [Thermoleophilia bacterium]